MEDEFGFSDNLTFSIKAQTQIACDFSEIYCKINWWTRSGVAQQKETRLTWLNACQPFYHLIHKPAMFKVWMQPELV